ncbi:uncharacterized protein LOC127867378 isoform X2 [Dreissena polymorpha]|uniref:Peptidase M12B domain-containing protein n=1 Tax=Dreissena polymorpha TaxID=45954 RepID=A0A9D4ND43_DREPO|nr:uncharacterized protein LOC127867378 isoform X2 [Dreissena polymorpha]KAH3891072.1 hypothetical protein DPMN_015163 [Dreissena polymorpha]
MFCNLSKCFFFGIIISLVDTSDGQEDFVTIHKREDAATIHTEDRITNSISKNNVNIRITDEHVTTPPLTDTDVPTHKPEADVSIINAEDIATANITVDGITNPFTEADETTPEIEGNIKIPVFIADDITTLLAEFDAPTSTTKDDIINRITQGYVTAPKVEDNVKNPFSTENTVTIAEDDVTISITEEDVTTLSTEDDVKNHIAEDDVADQNIVELLFCADASVYRHFLAMKGNDSAAVVAIHDYTRALANEIDVAFGIVSQVDPTFNLSIFLVDTIIAKSDKDASWSRDSQATVNNVTYIDNKRKPLDLFLEWRLVNFWLFRLLPPHDHAMAITMLPMINIPDPNVNPETPTVEGVAYFGRMCTWKQISLVRLNSGHFSITAAHEIAHNLGANHDSEVNCTHSDFNMMAGTRRTLVSADLASQQWRFSNCSVSDMKQFVSSLKNKCLRNHNFRASEYRKRLQGPLPGEVISLDDQCRIKKGVNSYSCQTRLHSSACHHGFHCSGEKGCNLTIYDYLFGSLFVYPFTGTPCSRDPNMWCFKGQCVMKPFTDVTNVLLSTGVISEEDDDDETLTFVDVIRVYLTNEVGHSGTTNVIIGTTGSSGVYTGTSAIMSEASSVSASQNKATTVTKTKSTQTPTVTESIQSLSTDETSFATLYNPVETQTHASTSRVSLRPSTSYFELVSP